jgi:putative ABC transport system permease protein
VRPPLNTRAALQAPQLTGVEPPSDGGDGDWRGGGGGGRGRGGSMSLLKLTLRNVLARPVRGLLTVLAVMVGIFLFCFLTSIVTSLEAAVKAVASNRIVVGSAVSLFQSLPTTSQYLDGIRETPGVASVTRFTWFGGLYPGKNAPEPQFGTDPEELLAAYPEVIIPPEQAKAWFEDKKGCILGRLVAEAKGYKVGDQVPLRGTIYPRVDGAPWTFNVRGIYASTKPNVDEQTMHFHWSYLDETLERGEAYGPRGTSVYLVKLHDGVRGEDVSAAVDARFEKGPQRTRTQTEAAFQAGFISMLGNLPTFLGLIGGAVVVALVFGVINTMTLAARERVRSMGILKSLGFSDQVPAKLYVGEALLLVCLGGALGIGLAWMSQEPFRVALGTYIPQYFVSTDTFVWAGIICLGIALLAGMIPAIRAARLKAVDALRT